MKNLNTYKGYRLLAIDGSKIPIFRDPHDKETFAILNQYSNGCNFLHLNALFDICNKVYLDASIQTYSKVNEFKALIQLVKRSPLKKNVSLTADRGFASYNNIAHLDAKGWKYVIRVKSPNAIRGLLSKTKLPVNKELDEMISVLMTGR